MCDWLEPNYALSLMVKQALYPGVCRISQYYSFTYSQDVNDAAKNDELETVPPEVMKDLAEMGAFGMQVCTNYLRHLRLSMTPLFSVIGSC